MNLNKDLKMKLSNEELKEFYDKNYTIKFSKNRLCRIERIIKDVDFNKEDIVADLGCGNGLLCDLIANKIKEYNGIDFSNDFIEIAKLNYENKYNNANFYCMNITDYCNNNKYDKAFTLDFSEHIYDDTFIEIYSAIKKGLNENGILYIHTPNLDFFIEKLKDKNLILKQFKEHIAVRNSNKYIELLKKAGFEKIEIHYLSHYLKPLSLFHWFSLIPYIGKYFKARLLIICQK